MSETSSVGPSAFLDPRDWDEVMAAPPERREMVADAILRYRRPDQLDVGDLVPPLALTSLPNGEASPHATVTLDALVGGRPVLLIFGSVT